MALAVNHGLAKIMARKYIVLVLGVSFSLLLACSNIESEAIESSNLDEASQTSLSNLETLESDIKEPNKSLSFNSFRKENGYLPPEQVIPELNSQVNDFTNTLSIQEREQLNLKLQKIRSEGLFHAGLVIVPTIGDMTIYDYTVQIAEGWALGSLIDNDGLLILMAMENKEIYILTGTGLDYQLDNKSLLVIIDNIMVPSFKQGEYAEGLSKGVDALVNTMKI